MDIQEFFSVSYYDFPKVTRSIYYRRTWSEMNTELTGSNMDFSSLLGEKDLVRALEAYEKAPAKNNENRDLYVLFRCYQYSVWGLSWNRDELVQAWESLNNPDDTAIEHIQNDCDNDDIVNDLLCYFTEKSSAKSCFAIDGLSLEECVLCDSRHDAMLYQLLMYLAYPEQARNGRKIIHCRQCGEAFIREHKNARYCTKCSQPSARTMRSRRKKADSEDSEE